ncbi:MAG: serine O-acetyltransferase EpsC [Gelidibacter sp.]
MTLIKKIEAFDTGLKINLPAIQSVENFGDATINFLFPVRINQDGTVKTLSKRQEDLKADFLKLLDALQFCSSDDKATLTEDFFTSLEVVFDKLVLDAKAVLDFDPAAKSVEEIINAYPGFYATAIYRISHEMNRLKIPFIPRILSEYAHKKTGIDIHPGASIGNSFFIDHGTGIVIGETAIIGNNVKIYQGVTLGSLQVSKKDANTKRHPTVKDNVIIYAGATVLGGTTTIGKNSVIGGNVWLTKSVPSYSVVVSTFEISIKNSKEFNNPIDFII